MFGAAVVVLAAVGSWLTWDRALSPKARALDQVRMHINDPSSATFSNVQHNARTGSTCGMVNAKNRMGGYVGNTPFIVDRDSKVTFAPTGNTEYGPVEQRIKALQDGIAFLELAQAQCPPDATGKH